MTVSLGTEVRSRLAVNAAVRTILQGLVVVVAVAAWAAARQAIGADGPIDWIRVLQVAAQAAAMAVVAYFVRLARTGRLEPVSFRIDAWIRTGRTLLIGLAIAVLVALYQVVEVLAANEVFDFAAVSRAVVTAVGMAVTAFVHRLAVDPSAIPSAPPPAPVEPAQPGPSS